MPISIAALGEEQLENNQIAQIRDFVAQVPNLFVNNFNGRADTVRLFISARRTRRPLFRL